MPTPAVELEIADVTVRVTNPDKVFFAARGETKLDLDPAAGRGEDAGQG